MNSKIVKILVIRVARKVDSLKTPPAASKQKSGDNF